MLRRAVQIGGFVMAVLSLVSYWIVDAKPEKKNAAAPNLIVSTPGQVPTVNIAVAGRDIEYCKPGFGPIGLKAVPCEGVERYGRTDTMMFVRIQQGRLDVISLPRDTMVNDKFGTHKLNSTFIQGGRAALAEAGITDLKKADANAEQLFVQAGTQTFKETLETLLGVNIDYVALFNVELVGKVIDALGGVDVYLPEPMQYTDRAANLYIDIPAGNNHLNGQQAVGYLRFRHGVGSDYARMDRGKAVIGQLLGKVKSPAVLGAIPTLLSGLQNDVYTNASTDFVLQMIGNAKGLTPHFYTLPTIEDANYGSYLLLDEPKTRAMLEPILNSAVSLDLQTAPKFTPSIVDQSGVPGLGAALAAYLERMGWGKPTVETLEAADTPTQIVRRAYGDTDSAEFFSRVLDVPVFTPYRYPEGAEAVAIVLGTDAKKKYGGLVVEAGRMQKP
jgi:polyisoprenyl-teichoic acid--peptidoglycan teichoic acid transferase